MNFFEKVKKLILKNNNENEKYKNSYAQSGEDMIVAYILEVLKVKHPFYIDVGAHHPEHFSNTKYFYNNGSCGINIEADPMLLEKFTTERTRDINLNIGIGLESKEMDFYKINASSLNTFCRDTAYGYLDKGNFSIDDVIRIKVEPINSVLNKYCIGREIDFISIDVEGLDEEIIKSIDFEVHRPKVIVVETVDFQETGMAKKNARIAQYLESVGYFLYADTNINSIFVLESLWVSR